MKRFKNKILFPAAFCIAAGALVAGCAGEGREAGTADASREITFSGISDVISTRVGESGGINLIALNDDASKEYFGLTEITSASPLGTSPSPFTLSPQRYYPLGEKEIRLFAFTGYINGSRQMQLTAGSLDANDFVLSNYGRRKSDTDINPEYEGKGTPGSSQDPAHILQFRHVMTQLEVVVEVDRNQSSPVDPEPEEVLFDIDGMYRLGVYPITAKTPDPDGADPVTVATDAGGGLYRAQLGMNYLVPSGINLVGQNFSYLKIDNYVATDDDLAEFEIAATNGEDEMYLYPGYAYRLTLKIQKLRLVGVELQQVDWIERSVGGTNPTYDPAVLDLDIRGGYENSGEDQITKVVLHTNERKQYVGQLDATSGELEFVTLPADNLVDTVDLFTPRGLLLSMPVEGAQYAAGTLSFNLSRVGMFLADPDNANSPDNPYLITTLVQFLNVGKDLAAFYRQEKDIELAGLDVTGVSSRFTGFGPFSGVYDGNSYWIGNLNVSCQGLFSENTGTLLNIRLYTGNMDLAGYSYAGSLCGINSGLIYACINEATLFNATGTVGGICGLNEAGGRVVASVNTGNIRQGTTMGGICGENRSTAAETFVSCLGIGNILNENGDTVGAIVGRSVQAASTVVINTCFWLTGAVEMAPGMSESAVGTNNAGFRDTAGLDPDKMRNGIDEGEDPVTDRVLYKLNTALAADADYIAGYSFVLDRILTGITWPMPYNENNID